MLSDQEFLKALESCALPECEFGHRGHVRAGYLYLAESNFADALVRTRRAIRAYATHLGNGDRYHETITTAFLALIQQCIAERGDAGGWATFAENNPELLDPNLLGRFYDREVLASTLARRVFVLPRAKAAGGSKPHGY